MKAPLATLCLAGAAALAGASVLAQPATTQPRQEFVWPERISNAQVLPADIGAERLRATMVGFARGLGVRCTFCHVGAEGAPLTALDFVSDANPHKNIARGMIRMVRQLNAETLPPIVGPSDQPRVTCFTCHRGATTPATTPPPPPAAPAAPQPAPAQGQRGLR
jgi:photosynthetic reaction center cytochrome c subunit